MSDVEMAAPPSPYTWGFVNAETLDNLVDMLQDERDQSLLKHDFQKLDEALKELSQSLRSTKMTSPLVSEMTRDQFKELQDKGPEHLQRRVNWLDTELKHLIGKYRCENDQNRTSKEQKNLEMRAVADKFEEKIEEFQEKYDGLLKQYYKERWNSIKLAVRAVALVMGGGRCGSLNSLQNQFPA